MNDLTTYRIKAKSIRRQCKGHKDKQPCIICGMHKCIAQAHHILPLKSVTVLLETWRELPEPPIVWMCPNHHALVHLYLNGKLSLDVAVNEIITDELKLFMEMKIRGLEFNIRTEANINE